jgi:hypothetical protein
MDSFLAGSSEGMLFDLGYADGITPALAPPESRSRTARGQRT